MMDEFLKQIMEKTGKAFNGNGHHIWCKTFKFTFKYKANSFLILLNAY